jgi:hypothetical protein
MIPRARPSPRLAPPLAAGVLPLRKIPTGQNRTKPDISGHQPDISGHSQTSTPETEQFPKHIPAKNAFFM